MGGTRFLPTATTAVRLLVVVMLLMRGGAAPLRVDWAGAVTDFLMLAWAVVGAGAFLLGWPRTKRGLLLMLLLDGVLACCLLLRGAPVYGLLLLLFGTLLWRAFGNRGPVNPLLLPFIILWAGLWILDPDLATRWTEAQPDFYDYLGGSLIVAVLAAAIWFSLRRESRLAALSGDVWIGPVFSTGENFAFDFTRWLEKVAALYGGHRSICLVGLLNRSKGASLFLNADLELDSFSIADDIRKNIAPERLSVEYNGNMAKTMLDASNAYYLFSLRNYSSIMSRRFLIGSRKGILVIAHRGEVDAIVLREMDVIDRAFEAIVARANSVMEMRTEFLVEAREVARRDLHDGVLQSLAAIRMRLLTMLQVHPPSDPLLSADIRATAEIVALEQARLRALLQKTMDEDLPTNLVEVLDTAIRTMALQWEMKIEFRSEEKTIPMHRESATNIELLIREIVANASQHMKALHLTCLLAIRESDLIITLKDILPDGHNVGALKKGSGPLSSESLKQRLAIVSGRAYSEGLPGGTLLSVAIPMSYSER